jgi:hypothetical protein
LSCGRVEYRVEKSKVLMADTWEKDFDLRLSKRSLEFFKIHIWFKKSEDLPYLYWMPKLHKTPYKERYIAGSSTCSTTELSILEDTWEKDLDLRLSKRSLAFFKIHIWFMPLREKTVSQYFCCPSFTADRIFVRTSDQYAGVPHR